MNFRNADLSEAILEGANLSGADLAGAKLIESNLNGAYLRGINLSEAILAGANFSNADLGEASLLDAKFDDGTNFSRAKLDAIDIRGANLTWVDFSGASLRGAKLSRVQFMMANLSEVDLSEATLIDADLSRADLRNADLSRANLLGAILMESNLSSACLKNAELMGASLGNANLFRADLSGANLGLASLVRTNLSEATLTNCLIYGISVWDVQLDGAKQFNLVITPPNQPRITVDNLKVAQLIYLLLNNEELRNVLNSVIERGILLLGRFGGGGLEMLQAIAAKLRDMNYLPMIFDFERPEYRDFTETIMTLAGLSRFVIADLSGPSVPNELRATIPHIKIPFVPIIEEERKIFSMFSDLLGYPWVLPPVEFTSKEHLMELLPSRVIEPAEEKFRERQALLNRLFNR